MAIILVVVGTLAQVDQDVWQVVDDYFRAPLAWIDLKVFFPPSFFPGLSIPNEIQLPGGSVVPLGFYFPGGWLIGGLMTINLLAALLVRFPVQARGIQRQVGWGVVGIGCLLTWMVIFGDATSAGEPTDSWISRDMIWGLFQMGLAITSLVLGFVASRVSRGRHLERGCSERGRSSGRNSHLDTLRKRLGSAGRFLSPNPLADVQGATRHRRPVTRVLAAVQERAGLVLLHCGIGLLMFGEVLTGLTAVEGHMQMVEGQTSSYVRHSRSFELAVIDHSDGERDDVVVVPESLLLSGRRIGNKNLPFDIQLVHYLKNSMVRQVKPGDANPATAGIGLSWLAEPSRPASGTDGGKTNMTAAYVTLLNKDTSVSLGTYLVGLAMSEGDTAEEVQVNGKTYEVALRQRRTYKPYSMKLIDVQKEDYPGTDIPRHYASLLHLVDQSRHVDRTVKIWMNNPLRFAGETFYQSGYFKDPETGVEASTLAVVNNTGWMIPYVGCMIVATGLLAQFTTVLGRFLKAQVRRTVACKAGEPSSSV